MIDEVSWSAVDAKLLTIIWNGPGPDSIKVFSVLIYSTLQLSILIGHLNHVTVFTQ